MIYMYDVSKKKAWAGLDLYVGIILKWLSKVWRLYELDIVLHKNIFMSFVNLPTFREYFCPNLKGRSRRNVILKLL